MSLHGEVIEEQCHYTVKCLQTNEVGIRCKAANRWVVIPLMW